MRECTGACDAVVLNLGAPERCLARDYGAGVCGRFEYSGTLAAAS